MQHPIEQVYTGSSSRKERLDYIFMSRFTQVGIQKLDLSDQKCKEMSRTKLHNLSSRHHPRRGHCHCVIRLLDYIFSCRSKQIVINFGVP
ncbi:unnamed protein product [Albugo candida]|uniref:Uncharacterized protein n=1 Tax=Albugo candida TaxID=65357 RepID=A0A024FUC0_9STRA|nr:unnamed protein product [Albugo candida]|eukprot:CCI10264.1 unnamed protein product [Albugo candida]